MLNFSLYYNYCMGVLVIKISTYDYGKNKGYTTDWSTTFATGRGLSPRQEPRVPHALSHNILIFFGLTSEQVGLQTEMTHISVNSRVRRFEKKGVKGLETRIGKGRKPIMDCLYEDVVR